MVERNLKRDCMFDRRNEGGRCGRASAPAKGLFAMSSVNELATKQVQGGRFTSIQCHTCGQHGAAFLKEGVDRGRPRLSSVSCGFSIRERSGGTSGITCNVCGKQPALGNHESESALVAD